MRAVSLAMVDINGLRRSWWWSVPGVIPYDLFTTVTINTALTGVGASSPVASGYMNTPGFDLSQVAGFSVDENSNWNFPGSPVPPPGQVIPRIWNYWNNLSVKPNTSINKGYYVKWRQGPVQTADGLIYGWDEYSNYQNPPLMADDWLCEDNRPITDIHWWGSFIGWTQPYPPQLPSAFHIGIWTDVPAGSQTTFSHPGKLIWETFSDKYVWNFAGYDLDPRGQSENEACFQFNLLLPQDEWFYQETNEPNGTVYWLSIAALYNDDTSLPQHPWGWKTRPHNFNDDAVRAYGTMEGTWPPTIGSNWGEGEPLEYPSGQSWDLAFELTTNEPRIPLSADLNLDGIVNLRDLAIMADQWLTTGLP